MSLEPVIGDDRVFSYALEQARNELLDLSLRNRALSTRPDGKHARLVQIADELTSQVYERLVEKRKAFTFKPVSGKTPVILTLAKDSVKAVGSDTADTEEGAAGNDQSDIPEKRHADSHLQTALPAETLAKRLVAMERDARTAIEEQGTNLLFLALGQLCWYEDDNSDVALQAPLGFVPVQLARNPKASADTQRFVLTVREGEEIFGNVSLVARLKQSFDLDLREPETEEESFSVMDYLRNVAALTKGMKRWSVVPNGIVLGFFSFQKYLMYLDLKPEKWAAGKALIEHPLFSGLLLNGLVSPSALFSEDTPIDELIPSERLDHVVDADTSQTIAIEKVRRGMNLVIQGPPGTGKSQTISNIIATAVLDGKRVLFVAEKMAALDVVKRRLEHEGLGPIFLELHGAGQSSARMLASVMDAWKLGAPVLAGESKTIHELTRRRDVLNEVPCLLHTPMLPSGLTPYQIMGLLSLLEDDGVEVGLQGVEQWTPDNIDFCQQASVAFGEVLHTVGSPNDSLWHGMNADGVLRIDLVAISSLISETQDALRALCQDAAVLAATINQRTASNLSHLAEQLVIGNTFLAAPDSMDRAAIAEAVWDTGRGHLSELLNTGRALSRTLAAIEGKVTADAHVRNWSAERDAIAAKKGSLFKFLNAPYRHAREALKRVTLFGVPSSDDQRLALLDTFILVRKCRTTITDNEGTARRAFGALWTGVDTEWDRAQTVLDWADEAERSGLGQDFRTLLVAFSAPTVIAAAKEQLIQTRDHFLAKADALAKRLVIDWSEACGNLFEEIPLPDLGKRLETWGDGLPTLPDWSRYIRAGKELTKLGIGSLFTETAADRLDHSLVESSFRRSYLTVLLRNVMRERPLLAVFDGTRHNRAIEEFRETDKQRLNVARHRVLVAHHANIPRVADEIGDIGFLRGEAERKRNRRSIRTIIRRAGGLVQRIKPVFLMSPLSVAQYLEPGAVEFDLLVIDEASQVKPVDALGAIARAGQVVVVGDSKQLPPTSFFERLSSSADEEPESEPDKASTGGAAVSKTAPVLAMESILSLCAARGIPDTSLRWHYRSRHHSLIAVSNHNFYDDRLFIVPSPFHNGQGGLGIRFHAVNGCYDRSRSRTNPEEARVVAKAIQSHARECPTVTLGVATFSTAQRDVILDELELVRRDDPVLESFMARECHEPFFVKNLESVQGDERDVIFISVGYGRDSSGYMANSFGPITGEHGARRLNVLFSRAKYRCEVFSSITDEDINISANPTLGVVALKSYLRFARTGILDTPRATGRGEDSPFETSVLRAIEAMGYPSDTQVGQSGFFIDLAVIDPDRPGRYLLGVECDGASYHSSRFARERDRLRQSVLEAQGWRIHRIWSTDWFQQPEKEKKKLHRKIESLRSEAEGAAVGCSVQSVGNNLIIPDTGTSSMREEALHAVQPVVDGRPPVTRAEPEQNQEKQIGALSVPYTQTTGNFRLGDNPVISVEGVIIRVLKCEAPIHRDELQNRCRELFGFSRITVTFEEYVKTALRSLQRVGTIVRRAEFFYLPDSQPVPRNRSIVTAGALRKPAMIAPEEYDAAIRVLLQQCHGASEDELAVGVARLLGFKSTSPQFRAVARKGFLRLSRSGYVKADADGVIRITV